MSQVAEVVIPVPEVVEVFLPSVSMFALFGVLL